MASKKKRSKPKYRIVITPTKITEDLRSWLRPDEIPWLLQVFKGDEVVPDKDVPFLVRGKLNTTEKGGSFLTVGMGAIWAAADNALLSLVDDIGEIFSGQKQFAGSERGRESESEESDKRFRMIDKYIKDHLLNGPAMPLPWKQLQFAIKRDFRGKPEFKKYDITDSYLNHKFPKKNYYKK